MGQGGANWMAAVEGTTPSERFPIYTRANVGEVFPDPVAPLSFSFAFVTPEGEIGTAEMGFRDAYVRMGAFEYEEFGDTPEFLGVNGGYCYLNASIMRLFGERAPGLSAADIDAQFFGAQPGIPPYEEAPGDVRPDLTAKLAETFGWALTTERLDEVLADEAMVDGLRAARPDLTAMSDRGLMDRWRELTEERYRELFGRHIYITMLATLPAGIIGSVCEALGRPEDTLSLMAGVGDVESAAPSMAMWELGRMVAASPELTALFDEGIPGLAARIAEAAEKPHSDAAGFQDHFGTFLYRYGSRGPNEWEVREPTWETEPDLALAAVDRMRLSPDSAAPSLRNAERAATRQALVEEIAPLLAGDPEAQGQFLAACRAAPLFMAGRERTKTNAVKLIQELRMILREYGRRKVESGHWDEVVDYGLLTTAELEDTVADPGAHSELIRERREALEGLARLAEPFVFVGSPPDLGDYPLRTAERVVPLSAGETLQGLGGCPGRARGRARVVLDSHDPSSLEPGDILVAPITDPSWTPLFVPAAAVVVDVGAPLSHAIIVSRELGIPCVVSATGSTARIPDGALVEVDGTTGLVTVLETP